MPKFNRFALLLLTCFNFFYSALQGLRTQVTIYSISTFIYIYPSRIFKKKRDVDHLNVVRMLYSWQMKVGGEGWFVISRISLLEPFLSFCSFWNQLIWLCWPFPRPSLGTWHPHRGKLELTIMRTQN